MKDEGRKTKKEVLKKQIDAMSDEELDQISGGFDPNSGGYGHSSFVISEEEKEKLENFFHQNGTGVCPFCGKDITK